MVYHWVSASNVSPSLFPKRDYQIRAAMDRMKPFMDHLGADTRFVLEIEGGPEPDQGIYGRERSWYHTFINPPAGKATVLVSGMAVKELSPPAFQGLAEHELCKASMLTLIGKVDMGEFRMLCEKESPQLSLSIIHALNRMAGLGNYVHFMSETMNIDYDCLDSNTVYNYARLERYFRQLHEAFPEQADEIMSSLVFRHEFRDI